MKKYYPNLLILLIIGLMISSSSCRKDFLTGFPDVEVINAPPTSSPIPDQSFRTGFGSATLNLSAYFSDPENDPLTFQVLNTDESVVTLSVSGATLNIEEVGPGVTEVTITASDQNSGNVSDPQAFNIIVEDLPPLEFTFLMDFEDVPDGTTNDDIMIQGGSLAFEGTDATTATVNGGVLEWTTEEFGAFTLTFDEPLDVSANSEFVFDYADLFTENVVLIFEDAVGNFSEVFFPDAGLTLEQNNPNFNTFSLLLEDYAENEDEGTTVDLTQLTSIFFEAFIDGGDGTLQTWKLDNWGIGPMEASAPFEVFLDFEFPDGNAEDVIAYDDFTVSFQGSDGTTNTITNGVLEQATDEFAAIVIDFNAPVDLSANSEMVFDYADLWDGEFYFFFEDASGNVSQEVEFLNLALDFTFDNVNFTTFDQGFQMSDFADNEGTVVDMTAITSIYFEKAAGNPDGSTVWKLDNLGFGKRE